MISPLEVERMVLAAIPDAKVEAYDMTGTADHFEIIVTSESFRGKSLIEQHQMVFASVQHEMDKRIHAVKIKTRTPK